MPRISSRKSVQSAPSAASGCVSSMSLLLNQQNELRSGWKFAVYVLFFVIIWFATGLGITILIAPYAGDLLENQLFLPALNQIALLVPALAAMCLTIRFVDHRPLRAFGVGLVPRWRRDFASGLGLSSA